MKIYYMGDDGENKKKKHTQLGFNTFDLLGSQDYIVGIKKKNTKNSMS